MAREDLLSQTFVQLADTFVDEFDIIDVLTMLADRCVTLLGADAAGILLADGDGNLRVMAASSEQAPLLDLFQLQNEEGPCVEVHSTGRPVVNTDLGTARGRWPRFAPEAVARGFTSVYALPLRLRSTVIGALNLFLTKSPALAESDIRLAQALADVASVALLHDQAVRKSPVEAGQLQHALDSRVAIEQAKGMLAERARVDMSEAFHRLRAYARSHNRQLTAVAIDLVSGDQAIEAVAAHQPPRRPVA